MSYTHIQFIGYSIDTAPDDSGDETYLGLADPQADILARCELMRRAITTARANLPVVTPPPAPGTVLKVFMAPEFYLRGSEGAYEMDDVQTAIAALQALVADDSWADWLFVFGTLLGVSDPPHPPLTQEIYNFALIQEGGQAGSGAKGARVVMKELKSHIDFISEYPYGGGLLLGQVNPLPAGKGSGAGRETQQVSYDGAGIFGLLGVTFATDICLDHLKQRLVKSPQLPGEQMVQVQLIPSCGANIKAAGVVAGAGGYVFNVDGHNSSHVVLQRVGRKGVIPSLGPYPVDGGDITLATFSPPVVATIADLYRDGPGEIVIFAARPMPARHVVPGSVVSVAQWRPPGGYHFAFELTFDDAGDFVTAMCVISHAKVNFGERRYFLPLDVDMRDPDGGEVHIQMRLIGGGTYDNAIWCRIDLPGFDFEGNAVQFDSGPSSQPLLTVW